MPPRYAYWTIIVDNQPTAFRSGSQEELMPTFKRLKAKNDSAVMMWFQLGKLWPSRVDAQEFMHARSETGRRGDDRQAGSDRRDVKTSRPSSFAKAPADRQGFKPSRAPRTAWTPRGEPSTPPPARSTDDKLDWKPKGEFVPAPKRAERAEWKPKQSSDRASKPDWKPKGSFDRERKPDWKPKPDRSERPQWSPKSPASPRSFKPSRPEKPEWKPKGSFDSDRKPSTRSFDREERPRSFKRPDFKSDGDSTRSAKPEWKPKGSFDRERKTEWKPKSEKPAWKPKGSFDRDSKAEWKPKTDRSERPQWTPRPHAPGAKPDGEKRKWVPKEEYKKSMGIEARRDSKWRPGGEHKDPKQKYKDAKKAKWTKFKQNIRARSGGKGKKSS